MLCVAIYINDGLACNRMLREELHFKFPGIGDLRVESISDLDSLRGVHDDNYSACNDDKAADEAQNATEDAKPEDDRLEYKKNKESIHHGEYSN